MLAWSTQGNPNYEIKKNKKTVGQKKNVISNLFAVKK